MNASSALSVEQQTTVFQDVRASIVIVSYNGKEKLLRCLISVLQTLEDDCEVIVVDNASSDGSAEAVEAHFPEIMLIRSNENDGFGAGNNLGVRKARGKYLIFLNPDTLVEEKWALALLAPFEADSGIGLTTAKILLAKQKDRINACGIQVHFTGLTLCRGLGRPRGEFNQLEEVDAVQGAAFAIRRELFEALGGFDEETFLYMEDTDISLRARLAGWSCVYTPDSVVFHDYSLRITQLKVFYQERNRYLMLLKILRWPTLFVLLPAQLLAEAVTWGFVLWRDRANIGNKLRAYSWVTDNWSMIMQKRKQTQRLRKVPDRKLLQHTTYKLDFDQVAGGGVSLLARVVFNPIFFVLRIVTVVLVWW